MHKDFLILLLFVLLCSNSSAQMNRFSKVVQKSFNWGFRAGFDAINTDSYQIYQNENEINGNIINQAGFQCALFGRINLGNFFIQPDIGYYLVREKYQLYLMREINPETQQQATNKDNISGISQSLNSAMLLGYNVVKSDAYIFNFFLGPNFKYTYIDKYKTDYNYNFSNKNHQFNLNLITGISANISYLYFDFRYEIYIPSKNYLYFSDIESAPNYLKDVSIKKNENILCFSLGMMF